MKTSDRALYPRLSVIAFAAICVLSLVVIAGCTHEKRSFINADGKAGLLRDIDPMEAYEIILRNRSNPNFVLLDIRTPEEFEEEHLEGAILIDYHRDDFQDEIKKLDRDKTYVIYCRVANRTENAFELMRNLKFKEVYNVVGGIKKWRSDGLPVVRK